MLHGERNSSKDCRGRRVQLSCMCVFLPAGAGVTFKGRVTSKLWCRGVAAEQLKPRLQSAPALWSHLHLRQKHPPLAAACSAAGNRGRLAVVMQAWLGVGTSDLLKLCVAQLVANQFTAHLGCCAELVKGCPSLTQSAVRLSRHFPLQCSTPPELHDPAALLPFFLA